MEGIAPPPIPTGEALCFDVFLFPRVLCENPLSAFGLWNDHFTTGVLAMNALVVITQRPSNMHCGEATTFDHDLTCGPRLVPYFGDTGVGQLQF